MREFFQVDLCCLVIFRHLITVVGGFLAQQLLESILATGGRLFVMGRTGRDIADYDGMNVWLAGSGSGLSPAGTGGGGREEHAGRVRSQALGPGVNCNENLLHGLIGRSSVDPTLAVPVEEGGGGDEEDEDGRDGQQD